PAMKKAWKISPMVVQGASLGLQSALKRLLMPEISRFNTRMPKTSKTRKSTPLNGTTPYSKR
ncbi:hypothetical protein L9Z73_24100, partial [Pseudomonas sp. TNT11]